MKKMQKLIAVLAVVFSAALFLTSCEMVKGYFGGGDVSFTVTFMADGEIYDETTVKEGEEVVFPKDPEKEGYTFVGWTYDGDTVFEDFEAGLNIVMHAKWIENIQPPIEEEDSYEVIFIVDGEQYHETTVKEGEEVVLPTDPEKEGYVFDGWYFESGTFFENGGVHTGLTLYAKWVEIEIPPIEEEDSYEVVFIVDGETYHETTVKEGEEVVLPTDPEKDGYVFDGWYFEGGTFFENGGVHTGLTLYAKLTKAYTAGLLYTKIEGGYEVSVGTATDNDTIIPATYKGESVIKIADDGFRSKSNIVSIKIPNGVTTIGNYAFYECSSLTTIAIPEGVTSIGGYAFAYCDKLIIYAEAENKPDGWELNWNDSNRPVYWYSDVKKSGNYWRYVGGVPTVWEKDEGYYTEGLLFTEITGGYEVSVGTATDNDIRIPAVYEGENVIKIANNGFKDKSNIVSIKIPDSITTIGNSAFRNCSSLTTIDLPEGVTSIGYYAFYNCSSLTTIAIPEGVTSIGSLTTIDLFKGVTSIVSYTFYGCSSLTTIIIPEGSRLTSIGGYAFSGCSSLTTIDLPNGVTSIGDYAFENCRSLTTIAIPEGSRLTSIGERAFYNCRSLTTIDIPEGVESIGDNAFSDCSSLTTIDISESVTTIGGGAFSGCSSLITIDIPEGSRLTAIGGGAFSNCSSLTTIVIPEGVTSIGDYVFENCRSLTTIVIPEGSRLMSIGYYAFAYCGSLTTIVIPEGVTSIGGYLLGLVFLPIAFEGCDKLVIYAEAESKPDGWNSSWNNSNRPVYWYSGNYKEGYWRYVDGAPTIWEKDEGYYTEGLQFTKITGGYEVSAGTATDNDIIIPAVYEGESVIKIANSGFSGKSNIVSVKIPDSVMVINSYAFENCRSLTTIVIPEGSRLTSIGNSAFYNCNSLTRIDIPESVTSIGSNAFWYCSSLTTIVIPEGSRLTSIGNSAFYNCNSLTRIDIPESVTSIGSSAFSGCSSLTTIVIPKGVTSIGSSAFYGCNKLTIYAEAERKPDGWNSSWNNSNRPMYWYSGEYKSGNYWRYTTVDGVKVPTPWNN